MTDDIVLAAYDVTAGYPGHDPILVGANIVLPQGCPTALLGANGSGKTTLLRCLSGAHRPVAGEIHLAGQRLDHCRAALRAHRRQVQLVLQDPDDQLFSADVRQDVSFGPLNIGLAEDEVVQRVDDALALLGVAHLVERPTHHLSYGERKRVAIAGAVAMRPQVLLLDEPTAGLDPVGVEEMLSAVRRLIDVGTTVVIATHDVDLALAWAQQVAVVVDGHVVVGPPTEVLAREDLMSRARLLRPWPLELARRLGRSQTPRTMDEVVELLR